VRQADATAFAGVVYTDRTALVGEDMVRGSGSGAVAGGAPGLARPGM
jgi:hypothetical protein